MTEAAPRPDHSFWRVHCHIGHHPGQWQYWYREQVCSVGYPPAAGYSFHGSALDKSWSGVRNALKLMREGDWIVASLPQHRVGRLGRVFRLEVEDQDWNPIVPARNGLPHGGNGRRILVRWELGTGPTDPSTVVTLPESARFPSGLVRATIRSLPMALLEPIREVMKDERNWGPIIGAFAMEAALSDYIALHPEQLEPGLISHAGLNVRELVMPDRGRIDTLLQDREGTPVIVECKQHAPSKADVEQVLRYRKLFVGKRDWCPNGKVRSILVHGGASRVPAEIAEYARSQDVELVYHQLRVNFTTSGV